MKKQKQPATGPAPAFDMTRALGRQTASEFTQFSAWLVKQYNLGPTATSLQCRNCTCAFGAHDTVQTLVDHVLEHAAGTLTVALRGPQVGDNVFVVTSEYPNQFTEPYSIYRLQPNNTVTLLVDDNGKRKYADVHVNDMKRFRNNDWVVARRNVTVCK